MENLITEHINIWTTAQIQKNGVGRGNGSANQSPHGIKKLRELILELAVRGKLVPQDPSDEPASVLLEKIAKEKTRLIKEGKIKKQQPLPEIAEDEKPFELPIGWERSRLGNLINVIRGITFPASEKSTIFEKGRVACLRTTNVQDKIEWGDLLFIREQFVKREEQFIQENDIVMSMANSRELVGKVAIVDHKPKFHTSFGGFLGVFRPICLNPFYIMLLLRVPANRSLLIDSANQTTNIANISLAKLNPLVLEVPPLSEQQRIVAKVDELMALCDQLEQQQTDSNVVHQTLVETLLTTLTTAADQDEFAEAWERIAEHFDTLFITEHSIDKLKQTILQLAVMGKLVPQDPNDEPASVLLEKIAKEKARLIKEGKIKKQKPLPEISDDEKPFDLPEGWEWARLGDITNRIGSGSTPRGGRSIYVASGIPFLRSQNIWNHGLKLNDVVFITEGIHQQMSNTIVLPNDILLNITGASLGRCAIYPDGIAEANVSQHVTIIRTTDTSIRFYLHLCILSPYLQCLVWERQVGMAREGLSKKVLELFEIPLPPLAEQHRIVAKVDELIAICDALKARLNDAQATQNQLADAIIEQAGKDGCNH